jgi:hypothetical protein
MNLPEFPVQPNSLDECVSLYSERLPTDVVLWPHVSLLLTAYMAWPNDEARRDSFVATYLVRSPTANATGPKETLAETTEKLAFEKFGGAAAIARPAFDRLCEEIAQIQRQWLLVADIFQMIVDMAHDGRIALRGGSSVSKGVELCELEYGLPGHSQLRKAWTAFQNVAHLIAASAYLAHEALANAAAHEASILKAIWIAPDAVLALAAGLQQFGLQPKSNRWESPILRPDALWRIPAGLVPENPFIVFRRLTEAQLDFLRTRRAPKKYIPAPASI